MRRDALVRLLAAVVLGAMALPSVASVLVSCFEHAESSCCCAPASDDLTGLVVCQCGCAMSSSSAPDEPEVEATLLSRVVADISNDAVLQLPAVEHPAPVERSSDRLVERPRAPDRARAPPIL